jgi:outer membrane biosynthesis protein TonB
MYGPRLSPKPPAFVSSLFNSAIFRFLVLVLVIFVGSEDLRLAMSVSIVFLIVMSVVNTENIREDFTQQVKNYIANYNLYESSSLPNNSEHFTEFIPQKFNFKCVVDVDKSDSKSTSRSSSPEPTPRESSPEPTPKEPTPKEPTPKEPTPKEPTPKEPTPKAKADESNAPISKKTRESERSDRSTKTSDTKSKVVPKKSGTIKTTIPVLPPTNKNKNKRVSTEKFEDDEDDEDDDE